jgi:hypothetical protein
VSRSLAKNAPNNVNVNEVPSMTLTVSLGPVIALVAGILILIMPRLLNYIVAIYLIIIGLLGLFGSTHGIHV